VETGFGLKDVFTFVTRHLIPAVHQVDEKASTSWWLASLEMFGDEGVILTMGRVNEEVKATSDGKAELAFGEEKCSEGIGIHLGKDGASEAAPDSADADGAEFVRVVGVFVEGEESTKGQILSKLRRDVVVHCK